ncbi:unnamed protein product [Rhodiola kirilowii]
MQFPMSVNNIELLDGNNFHKWKADVELSLGILGYDRVLKENPPATLPENANKEAKDNYEKWFKHNKMALIVIKKSMANSVRGSFPDAELAKDFMESIAAKYTTSNKAETGKLMKSLMGMEYDGKGSVREYIMKGSNIVAKLKDLKMNVEESFLVHMLLNTLPDHFNHLKSLYKTQKEQWTVNELISLCVEVEDETTKKGKEKVLDVNLMSKAKHKRKFSDNLFKNNSF